MSHLPFTLLAYFLNAVAVLIDKFLLVKHIQNPLIYVFYFSLYSLVALLALPFVTTPTLNAFLLASVSTILWTLGAYLLFSALRIGLTSRVIPIIGTLIPTFLLFHASIVSEIKIDQVWAVVLLILGLLLLTLSGLKGKINSKEILLEIASALLFAFSYLLLRDAYLQSNFLSVLVYSRLILIPLGIALVAIPATRIVVLNRNNPMFKLKSKVGLLFMLGQAAGGISELLLTFSISLATPALVNSLQGVQYVFLFLFSLFLAKKFPSVYKESLSKSVLAAKIFGIIFIAMGLFVLAFAEKNEMNFKKGFTFSPRYASELGLDPKVTFNKALDELNFQVVRIPVYWDEIETDEGQIDISESEYYVRIAQEKGLDVILVLGFKQPRWPECFQPDWAIKLSQKKKQDKVLNLIQTEVKALQGYSAIKSWQIENEPFLTFGECLGANPLTEEFLKKEIAAVKALDSRPVLITESGELTTWRKSISIADISGISLYRDVWNPTFGYTSYPFPPFFYSAKAALVKTFFGKPETPSIVSELQTEPWVPGEQHISTWDIDEQVKTYPAEKLQKNFSFAKETGFKEILVWGVEWWYFMEEKGHPEYLQVGKNLK